MVKKTGPYIGVTGFMSNAEVSAALTLVPHDSVRRLMVGILMSYQTLSNDRNELPNRYPKKEEITDIFVDHPQALNLIHYRTDHPETLLEQLIYITELAGPHLDGFQLNIAWPPIPQLKAYREAYPDTFLVLQISSNALARTKSTEQFEALVCSYSGAIDAILIDSSDGKGEPFDAMQCVEYLHAAHACRPFGLGVAGGLGPNTLHLLDLLIEGFPELSIDAEGQLRTQKPEDALCLSSVRTYLEDAFPILAGKRLPGIKLRKWSLPYGIEEHVRYYDGTGTNMLRTEHVAQPSALQAGDILATGDKLLSPPREAGNGGVWLHLSGGRDGHWIDVPARIPLALQSEAMTDL